MRAKFSGISNFNFPVLLSLLDGSVFEPNAYIADGFTKFDVICIGGGGGQGSSYYTGTGATLKVAGGGGPGGGGLHRVSGLLATLPSAVPITVGAQGADGPVTNVLANAVAGGNGGVSSFNGTLCRASGGTGGQPGSSSSSTAYTTGAGGAGGAGNSGTAGGGGAGGSGSSVNLSAPSNTTPTAGSNGTWNGVVGTGGGGGAGGYKGRDNVQPVDGTTGGYGNYNASDGTAFGYPSSAQSLLFSSEGVSFGAVLGGHGGGGKAQLINDIIQAWGSRAIWPGAPNGIGQGAVIVRLT